MSQTPSAVPGPLLDRSLTSSLASYLAGADSTLRLRMHLGRQIVQQFTSVQQELHSILTSAAVFDLGYRRLISVRGGDHVRWLNGMITNTIKDLPAGGTNYSFVLNAQGRIQGDLTAYRFPDHILLETDESQAEALFAHFDHFIIMDDVALEMVQGRTGIGIAGPQASAVLQHVGLPAPREPHTFIEAEFDGHPIFIAQDFSPSVPRFVTWVSEEIAPTLSTKLSDAGAVPAGADALQALRVLDGTPQYGIDFTDRHLAQEIDAPRALNFNKGCYLGQEIVERIRSRATVHRRLRQLELTGPAPTLHPGESLPILADGQPGGEITSIAELDLPQGRGTLALAILRNEPIERGQQLTYSGEPVRVLDAPAVATLRESLKISTEPNIAMS